MQELCRSARELQLAEPGTGPLWQNPGNINSDSSDAVGSRGASPSPKERYIAVAFGYRNGADQTVHGKKAAIAREWGFPGITLDAQLHAIPFYEHLGYSVHGEVFLDAGIEHRVMDLAF